MCLFSDVKLIDGAIDSLEIDDVRLKNVKVVLIHGQCSKTAILDPVGFVITEGEGQYLGLKYSLGSHTFTNTHMGVVVTRLDQMK